MRSRCLRVAHASYTSDRPPFRPAINARRACTFARRASACGGRGSAFARMSAHRSRAPASASTWRRKICHTTLEVWQEATPAPPRGAPHTSHRFSR